MTAVAGQRAQVTVVLRATAFRVEAGERLRVAVSCADFPRIWPTPVPATLRLFCGASMIELPVRPVPPEGERAPRWGPVQAAALASRSDLGGKQTWNLSRDLMTDGVRLDSGKVERIQIDAQTELTITHDYWASVDPARPDLARMGSTTTACSAQAAGSTNLVTRTVSTAFGSDVDVKIEVDGQPFWQRHWHFDGP